MPNVEIQALYYGSDWSSSFANAIQVSYLDGFLKNLVNSSYMDALWLALGHGVGRGTVWMPAHGPGHRSTRVTILTDAQIASRTSGFAVWNALLAQSHRCRYAE